MPDDQEAAFDDRATRPPRAKDPVRWICGKCGSLRVRPDAVAALDPRYTTGACHVCRKDRVLIRLAGD